MNPIKKLASQTVIYGFSSIAGRFLNYLLTYLYTRVFALDQFGVNSEFYAYSGVILILLTFGMETGFFRFSKDAKDPAKVYSTCLNFIGITSLICLGFIHLFGQPIANIMLYPDNVEYIYYFGWILALDAVSSIPFAKLRAENRPLRFASVKLLEILVNVGLNIFFLAICRKAYLTEPGSWLAQWYNPAIGVGYIFIANLAASAVKTLLLLPQLKGMLSGFDRPLFNKIVRYSLPMVFIGLAGTVNEMLDRMVLKYYLPYDTTTNLSQLGIYAACYKLATLMTLFIQAFKFAGEPFFFAHSDKENSRQLYADVTKYFTIFCVAVFLLVMLYLDWFQLFIGEKYRVGLAVVPILLIANLFFGLYVNLSLWYKLSDRTLLGAAVAIGGAVLTLALNLLLIPKYGYMASAWATLACYSSITLVSYFLGQKYYPVPYNLVRIGAYILFGIVLWAAFEWSARHVFQNFPYLWVISTGFMAVYLAVAWLFDGRQLLGQTTPPTSR